MSSIPPPVPRRRVVIGVDAHKFVHAAAVLSDVGKLLETRSFPADSNGYEVLLDWAHGLGAQS